MTHDSTARMRPIAMPVPKPPAARRRCLVICGLTAALGGLAPWSAHAQQAWPQKAIRIVVPYAPGGSADLLGRLVGKHLTEVFKQPVVVENKAGAGGIIGSQIVSRSPADGYTLVVSGIGSHVIAPVDSPSSFDPMKDFTHIAMLAGPPLALLVNSQLPIRDLDGFMKYANGNSNGLVWASPGQGTHGHLTGELLKSATRLNLTHVSYKGAGAAMADLLGNIVPAAVMTLSSAEAHIKSGKLRLIALSSAKRLPAYPDTPTFAELGYPALTGTTWFGLSGPAGMPRDVVDKLNAEVRRGMQTPAAKAQLAQQSMVTADLDATQFKNFVAAEIAKWAPAARTALSNSR